MKINHLAFDKFYKIILEHFRKKELSEQEKSDITPKQVENFEVRNCAVYLNIFGSFNGDARKLYRLRGDIRKAQPHDGEIDDDFFIACLKYIDIDIPNTVKPAEIAEDDKKVQVYYQYFLERYYPEYLDKFPVYKVYNEDKNSLKFRDEVSSTTVLQTKFSMNENEIYGNMNIDVIKLINDFFQLIATAKYDQAWNLISPTMQNRVWKNNIEAFSIGYTNTISVNDVHVWDVKVDDKTANCKVFYEDIVQAYTAIELGNLEKITVGNLDDFCERINKIKLRAKETSLTNFDKVELHKFFEPAHSEYIWYKCGMNPESIKELYDSEAVLAIPRLYNISCIKDGDNWYIKAITSIKNSMYR